ncbi:M3 family oligoendopeptidase [Paenibacillus provencensis]|uniref:M3 family oligoendopeptidase n=1 Tax=Paenibacillus provencensis TaxID=441151 RepID=A0ABW3Q191_9BACL|nr:M3 family oligoendopeptidase [Paenibacillus sp. MER 78]MCM3129771.1 M3 family oligoendopeptidase [Paenibacillus sp. MER 78]
MSTTLKQTWDLESVFSGGSSSASFAEYLKQLEQDVAVLDKAINEYQVPKAIEDTYALDSLLDQLQDAAARLYEGSSFTACLGAQNQDDKKAVQLSGRIAALSARLAAVQTMFDSLFERTSDAVWSAWMERPEIKPISFVLNESRLKAKEKMSPELENLALDLAVDGYHGWGEFYDTIVSKVRVPFEVNGETVYLSAGQAANKLQDPDRNVREKLLQDWEKAWSDAADYCADTLNHLAGFRLKLYERRGWDSVLKEPLSINRMSQDTLDAMWNVITRAKPTLVKFLERKAQLLGVEQLSWADVDAPITSASEKISYDDAAVNIVNQFRKFSPRMAEFAQHAFDHQWIEAEDRPGKRPGGFCTGLPVSKETRIFMTYAGTASNVSTLAHELGHGYHQHVMDDMEMLNQNYAMNVAETASTFAELIVSDALIKEAKDEEAQIALLEEKIQNSIAFFMNIHARFLFETRFYEKRKEGLLSSSELSELMEEAQREAYCDALGTYHPTFWASKLHFYITDVPFYNFPYTFGYMFSMGIYAQAQKEGSDFAEKYDALLRDTGRMTVEELAEKHLGTDVTKPAFWQGAADLCISDIEQFLSMTQHRVI